MKYGETVPDLLPNVYQAIRVAMDVGLRQGKTPIVVCTIHGFVPTPLW